MLEIKMSEQTDTFSFDTSSKFQGDVTGFLVLARVEVQKFS